MTIADWLLPIGLVHSVGIGFGSQAIGSGVWKVDVD